MIDDSELFHGTYDPAKAREYYLRTRKLKGRRPAAAIASGPGRSARRPTSARSGGGKANRANTKSRRAELLAQKKALEKRLDRLREVLAQRVKEAKALNASNASKPKKVEKGAAPETKADKADRNAHEKSKKLTSSQKASKAKKAKEAYEKEHPNSLSTDVEILQEQVKDIRAKINKAVSDAARARKQNAGKTKASLVRRQPRNQPNDGPQGR